MNVFRSLLFIVLLHASFLFAAHPEFIETWPDKSHSPVLIRDWIGQGDYLNPNFTRWIDKNEISTILEIGSRDAIDALDLSNYYQAHVYAFECNPQAISICKHNIGSNPNISLVPLAAWNQTTTLPFFPVIPGGAVVCIGASSLFQFDPNGPVHNTQLQGKITVPAVRLDEWLDQEGIETVDLLCIDAQGATLQIVQGLGDRLANIKYIIAEVEYVRYYLGEALHPEIDHYLRSHGFTPVAEVNPYGSYADILFIRNDLL